ncbi:hypothetical protein D3C85_1737420 [compost metagenome]
MENPKSVSRLLTDSVLSVLVSGFTFSLSNGDHKHHNLLINHLIDQPIAGTA